MILFFHNNFDIRPNQNLPCTTSQAPPPPPPLPPMSLPLPEIPQQLPPVVNLIQQQPQFIQPQSSKMSKSTSIMSDLHNVHTQIASNYNAIQIKDNLTEEDPRYIFHIKRLSSLVLEILYKVNIRIKFRPSYSNWGYALL
jgi:hypothetical protein